MDSQDPQQNAWQQDSFINNPDDSFWTSDLSLDFDAIDLSSTPDPRFATVSPDWLDATTSLESLPASGALFDGSYLASQQVDALEFQALQDLAGPRSPPKQHQHTLPRRRSRYVLRRPSSRTGAIAIASNAAQFDSPMQSLAMQRWQNSPPEDEAASLLAIYNAMERRSLHDYSRCTQTRSFDALQTNRGPSSTTSLESAASESSLHSFNSNQSASSKRRSRVVKSRGTSKGKNKKKTNVFNCTFCTDSFKHKYDWSRHEKSLHLNTEEWICAPHGGAVVLPTTGRVHCAYCSALDPTHGHLEQHHHSACQGGHSTPRTFRRKDHLVQHLRLVHGLETLPLIDDWKVKAPAIVSRCGFCDLRMKTWEERTAHLAGHFHEGKTMKDWRGEHGFEPAVMARVTYAFPPYLIAHQAETLVPFSVTNKDSIDHTQQLLRHIELADTSASLFDVNDIAEQGQAPSPSEIKTQKQAETHVFADILTQHLSRFARSQMLKGIIPTDEMFQRESRRVLYQDEDEWNQTVADNPEWIKDFRKRAGFN